MENENRLTRQNNPQRSLAIWSTTGLSKGSILKEQPDSTVALKQIANLLKDIGDLYQIPGWNEITSLKLSKWILSEYSNELIDDVVDCLASPPYTGEKNWRLTPDTIREWMAIKIDERAEKRERDAFKLKELEMNTRTFIEAGSEVTAETQKMIDQYLDSIKNIDIKSVRSMTEEEIEREGKQNHDPYKQWKKDHGY